MKPYHSNLSHKKERILSDAFFSFGELLLDSLNGLLGHSLGLSLSLLQESADRQANLLVIVVDVDDLSVNDLTNLQNVGGLADLVVSDLRNVLG